VTRSEGLSAAEWRAVEGIEDDAHLWEKWGYLVDCVHVLGENETKGSRFWAKVSDTAFFIGQAVTSLAQCHS